MQSSLSIDTSRLNIRWLDVGDVGFAYHLVNDPMWIRHIGDKQVSNLARKIHKSCAILVHDL
ncbi:MAG: hypothetical protein GY935_24665 [Gammaproteobacteria bacterium]|nr:hypothetical protein [Gammaproteobacteria bacterium]